MSVKPASGIRHPRKFMGMLSGNLSLKMAGLGSSFQAGYNNYMVAEALEEYQFMNIWGNMCQWYLWPQEENFMTPEIILTG